MQSREPGVHSKTVLTKLHPAMPFDPPTASGSIPPEDNPRIFSLGDIVGDAYEIRALLGEGGMGQVFDAYDKNLSRRVAIKANFPDVPQSVRPEAQGLAAVRHGGVVGVYAFGTHAGVDYMVMEHVAGVTLAHHLERLEGGGLPLVERLDILIAIADGLAAIHRAGISHGDVKPENVLLSASGRVVLTDLGLVRAAYEPDGGLVAGTPSYMAPEIVSPKFANAGWPFVDEYAFGVLAFRMLSGRLPFIADSPLDLVLMHAEISAPRLEDFAPLVPRRLCDLVEHLLQKEPTERPQSMDAVVWQLRTAKEEIERESVQSAATPLTVLVVDDDADIGRLVAMYVKQAAPNAEIAVVRDAQQALEVFRKKPPRLVFLDLMMPKTSGFELFTYLRGVHLVDASTVVAMSAGGSATDVQLMLELGAHDFIAKGPELRGRVKQVVSMLARTQDAAPGSVR
jgi:eukaryotic-like serine/threonine-protein kinase